LYFFRRRRTLEQIITDIGFGDRILWTYEILKVGLVPFGPPASEH